LKLNGTHKLLVYADDVQILCGSIHGINKNKEILVVASKEIEIEENADKTTYMIIFQNQNARQSHNIKIDNKSFERWNSSNIWEQPYWIKILFRKKLRAD